MYEYTDENEQKIYEALCQMSAEDVVNAFLNYHGTQLIDSGFGRFLVNEGLMKNDAKDGEEGEE